MASRRKSSIQSTLQPVDTNRRFTLGPVPTRKSLGGGRRVSTIPQKPLASNQPPQSRRQSMMPRTPSRNGTVQRRAPGALTDPRNFKDPRQMTEAKARLKHFLDTHDYPHGMVDLNRPSNKDFNQIFEFLLQQRDPNFQLGDQALEEIPLILKGIGYPWTITKSTLVTCGAPHTWPNLMAVLSWMCELCEYDEASVDAESGNPEFSTFFEFLVKSYSLFLEFGDDNEQMEKMEADVDQLLKSNCDEQRFQIIKRGEQKAEVLAQIENMKNSEKRPQVLSQTIDTLQKDISKYQKYIQECQTVDETLDKQYEVLVKENNQRKQEGVAIGQLEDSYESQLANQALKPGDIEHINLKRSQLAENLQQTRGRRLMCEDKLFKREIEYSQSWDVCEKALEQYVELCTRLRLIPNERNEVDFQLTIGTINAPKLIGDIKNTIKPNLKHLMELLRVEDLKVDEVSLRLKESIDLIRDKLGEANHFIKQSEIERDKIDKQRQTAKLQMETELGNLYEQIEIGQREKEEIEATITEMTALSQQAVQRELEDYKRVEEECKRRHTEYFDNITEAMSILANYKQMAQQHLNALKGQLETLIETTRD